MPTASSHALVAAGLSHHTAPVSVREKFSLTEEGVRRELVHLRRSGIASEAMLLSTCNRVELYAVPEGNPNTLRDYLNTRFGAGSLIDPYLYWHRGEQAVRHLFRVASSLDSLVVGEPQILGQVKSAARLADESESLGMVLNRLTQRSFWVAKQVRNRTDIGRYTVGVGNAGVFLAEQIFSTLKGRTALLVGVGEMGRQVAKALLQAGVSELLVANRTFERSVMLAQEYGANPVQYDKLASYLSRVDIVITATGAQEPIIRAKEVKAAMRARRHRSLFLVDLAVPRNIDPDVERIDQAYVFNVDDLTSVMEKGRAARQAASLDAESLVSEESERFAARLDSLQVNAQVGALHKRLELIRQAELERSKKLTSSLDDDQLGALDQMTRALVKKVMHQPLANLREALAKGDMAQVDAILRGFEEPRKPR